MAELIVEVFGDDASGDNSAALMSRGKLRSPKTHRGVNAGEREREAPGIGWESSRSKGASALKLRCSVYIGYFEISNRVHTLILDQGCSRHRLRSLHGTLQGKQGRLHDQKRAKRRGAEDAERFLDCAAAPLPRLRSLHGILQGKQGRLRDNARVGREKRWGLQQSDFRLGTRRGGAL